MSDESSDHVVRRVVERLSARYPEAPRAQIEGVVAEEYEFLDGGRIRIYVPTLVEHSANDRLRREWHRTSRPGRALADEHQKPGDTR